MAQTADTRLTNFELVGKFHEKYGHPKRSIVYHDLFNGNEENEKLINLRVKLIDEEFNELKKALQDKNMCEVIDALSDILYVVYGAGHAFGINLDESFNIVHESNMTKSCDTEEEAKASVEVYKTKPGFENVEVSYRKVTQGDYEYYVLYNVNDGKILKSAFMKQPDFTEMLQR
jgi:hypothetical protein